MTVRLTHDIAPHGKYIIFVIGVEGWVKSVNTLTEAIQYIGISYKANKDYKYKALDTMDRHWYHPIIKD